MKRENTKKFIKQLWLSMAFALVMLALLVQSAEAGKEPDKDREHAEKPVITNVTIDFDKGEIDILGRHLHSGKHHHKGKHNKHKGSNPVVVLGDLPLDIIGINPDDPDGLQVITRLPVGIKDGAYLLMVITDRGFDKFEVTIGQVGPRGLQGLEGPKGARGVAGIQGPIGPQGLIGLQGPKGDKGDTGAQGLKGDTGSQGVAGAQGPKGDSGSQGVAGVQGPKGDSGLQGVAGVQGPKGDSGLQGIAGVQGPKGDKGDTGLQGPVGPTGPEGTSSGTVKGHHIVEKWSEFGTQPKKDVMVFCPPGSLAFGGGFHATREWIHVSTSVPRYNPDPTGWQVIAHDPTSKGVDWRVIVWAICAPAERK